MSKTEGTHDVGKPIQHDSKPGYSSGRKHPPVVDPNKVVRGLSTKDLPKKNNDQE